MQDIEDFPSLLHSTAGSGILSNGGDSPQNGRSILSLQSAAADHHDGTLGGGKDLETNDTWAQRFPSGMPRVTRCPYLAEGVRAVSQLLQHRRLLPQVVVRVAEVNGVTHHSHTKLVVEPTARGRGGEKADGSF